MNVEILGFLIASRISLAEKAMKCSVPSYRMMSQQPQFHNLVEAIWKEGPVTIFKDKINFRLPSMGSFPPPQDVTAEWKEFGPHHITIRVALDPDDEASRGALNFVPGNMAV